MYKILFIPSNDTQVKMFKGICNYLDKCEILSIGIDKYKHENAEETLKEMKIPFKSIQSYHTQNPKRILKYEMPDIICVGNDIDHIPGMFVEYANRMNIPTLLVQDGVLFSRKSVFGRYKGLERLKVMFRHFIKFMKTEYTLQQKTYILSNRILNGKKIYGHGNCLKIAVMGKFTKNLLVNEGMDPKCIVVTGQPRLDDILNKEHDKKEIYRRLDIPLKKGIITLLTQPFLEYGFWDYCKKYKFILNVVDEINKLEINSIQLVIKLHPREDISGYEEILKKVKKKPILCKNIDLYELINASKIVVTVSSTTALEAMILSKPVIIVDLFNEYPSIPYTESRAAIEVRKKENFLKAIEDILYKEEVQKELTEAREKFIYKHCYKIDGKAAERVSNLIFQMIEESRREKT